MTKVFKKIDLDFYVYFRIFVFACSSILVSFVVLWYLELSKVPETLNLQGQPGPV